MKLKLITGVLAMLPMCASADWQTTISEDAFSSLKNGTMAAITPQGNGIVFDCKGAGLSVAYLEADSTTSDKALSSVDYVPMMVKVDGKPLDIGEGVFSRRNDNYIVVEAVGGMSAYDALYKIRDAKKTITLSVKIKGHVFTVSVPAANVKKATSQLIAGCKLEG
ncbi:hypothetical protein [Zymobacter sp. IVIA_5232.4 C2]|uniref:hypothetical protein n=1 Tax=Zymobacter sp. IVIA_5232.4 C2 TaxID=3394855 RepID=UPI0039C32073